MTFLATSGNATLGGRVRRFEAPILPIAVIWVWTKGTRARRAWLPSAPRAVTGRRVLAELQSVLMAGSLLILSTAADVLAAPITGSNQAEPAFVSEQPPSTGAPAVIGDSDATVIEFSVMPSADDPTMMETIVLVQREGGRRVCVNLKFHDAIARSYRKRGDEPFAPAVPGDIRGLTSGDTGSLVAFNEITVIIRPDTPGDTFTNPDECFIAAGARACFVPEEDDCQQLLEEGDVACVLGTISRAGCSVRDHANLTRQMRILVTLNRPLGDEPIITAADIPSAPVPPVPPEPPGGDPPEGPGPGGPPPTDPTPGGGSDVTVPNVLGLLVPAGEAILINAGLAVGTVFLSTQFSSLDIGLVRSAWNRLTCGT